MALPIGAPDPFPRQAQGYHWNRWVRDMHLRQGQFREHRLALGTSHPRAGWAYGRSFAPAVTSQTFGLLAQTPAVPSRGR